jgi:YHS domain-containing protein
VASSVEAMEVMMEKDPVCGMQVDRNKAQYHMTHKGKDYYFCSQECKKQFERNPERYIESKTAQR